jgi:hypothetical protein
MNIEAIAFKSNPIALESTVFPNDLDYCVFNMRGCVGCIDEVTLVILRLEHVESETNSRSSKCICLYQSANLYQALRRVLHGCLPAYWNVFEDVSSLDGGADRMRVPFSTDVLSVVYLRDDNNGSPT